MNSFADREISSRIFFTLAITSIWAVLPVASVFLIFFLIYKMDERSYNIPYLLFLVSLSFGLIAYTAVSVDRGGEPTDITRYAAQFRTLAEIHTLKEFIFSAVLTDGGIYVVFQLTCLLLAKTFPTNPQVLPLFWVAFEYFFLQMAIYELSIYRKPWEKNTFLILAITLLFGTSLFTIQVELLKQSSATALAAYAIFRYMNGKKNNGWIFLISLLIHSSVLIFLPILLFGKKQFINRYYLLILGGAFCLSLIDINKAISLIPVAGLAERASFYADIEGWTINKINYALTFLYTLMLLLVLYDSRRKNKDSTFDRLMFNTIIVSYSVLIAQFHSVHNFVRYTYLHSPFYIVTFFSVFTGNMTKLSRLYIAICFILVLIFLNISYTWTYLNSTYTNSFMDNSLTRLFTSNVYVFLNYKAVN